MSEPGWYADPSARFQFRWWDGEVWTTQVSSNQVNTIDAHPLAPPQSIGANLGPEPAIPFDTTADGPAVADPLFTVPILQIEEIGDPLSLGHFGSFTFASPEHGPIGHVDQIGDRYQRRYQLNNAKGLPLATLKATTNGKVWVLTDNHDRLLGEYTHNHRLGIDMLMPISVGGQQIAEVQSDDLRGTRLTLSDLAGPLATIDRPKGFFADSYSTLDNYTMTRHRHVEGFLAYLSLMAPVAIDEARFRRDVRNNRRNRG